MYRVEYGHHMVVTECTEWHLNTIWWPHHGTWASCAASVYSHLGLAQSKAPGALAADLPLRPRHHVDRHKAEQAGGQPEPASDDDDGAGPPPPVVRVRWKITSAVLRVLTRKLECFPEECSRKLQTHRRQNGIVYAQEVHAQLDRVPGVCTRVHGR